MEVTLSDKYIDEIVQARVDKRTEHLQEVVKTYQDQNSELQKKLDERVYLKVSPYSTNYYSFDEMTEKLERRGKVMMSYHNTIQQFNNKTFLQKLGFILRGEKLNV